MNGQVAQWKIQITIQLLTHLHILSIDALTIDASSWTLQSLKNCIQFKYRNYLVDVLVVTLGLWILGFG